MKLISILVLLSLLTACGASDNSIPSQLTPEIQGLKGRWLSDCAVDKTDNDSSLSIESYGDEGVVLDTTFFTDSDCSIKEVSTKLTGAIAYVGEKILASGQTVKKVDVDIETATALMLIHDERAINIAIEQKICSRTDWDQNKYINISNCDTFSSFIDNLKGRKKNIYFIDGDQIFWGNTVRPNDVSGYPTELGTIPSIRI